MQHNCGLWCTCLQFQQQFSAEHLGNRSFIYKMTDFYMSSVVILSIYHVYCHCKVFYSENKLDSLCANRLAAALT